MDEKKWKNSIRHNISMTPGFQGGDSTHFGLLFELQGSILHFDSLNIRMNRIDKGWITQNINLEWFLINLSHKCFVELGSRR